MSSYFSTYKAKNKIVKDIYRYFHKFLIENKWEGKCEEMVKTEKAEQNKPH